MAQIVIEIPDEVKQAFDRASNEDIYGCYYDYNSTIGKAIKIGIVLPKGHGRLIDISQIDKDKIESSNPVISLIVDDEYIEAVSLDYLSGLQTIIEADRSEK